MTRISPFHCGSQYLDWTRCNCDRCVKQANYNEDVVWDTANWKCKIEEDLCYASVDDGTISKDIADRMGYKAGEHEYIWMCPEVEWTKEWIKEKTERDAQQTLF